MRTHAFVSPWIYFYIQVLIWVGWVCTYTGDWWTNTVSFPTLLWLHVQVPSLHFTIVDDGIQLPIDIMIIIDAWGPGNPVQYINLKSSQTFSGVVGRMEGRIILERWPTISKTSVCFWEMVIWKMPRNYGNFIRSSVPVTSFFRSNWLHHNEISTRTDPV